MTLFDTFRKRREEQRFRKQQLERKETVQETAAPATQKASAQADGKTVPPSSGESRLVGTLLRSPHVTEKAVAGNDHGAYTFLVSSRATKPMIQRAVSALYNVTVEKVRTITVPAKRRFARGRYGERSGFRKAVVYIKEGQTIDLH